MTTPSTARSMLEQLRLDFAENPAVLAKINAYVKNLPVVDPAAYLVEFDEQEAGEWVTKRHAVLEKPEGPYLDCSTPLYKEVMHPQADRVDALVKTAREVLSWTEAAYRPPVRDRIEMGRMVGVRLHALADLREALLPFEQQAEQSTIVAENPVEIPSPEPSPAGQSVEMVGLENDSEAEQGLGLYEATYLFEKMGYVGMDRVRETLKKMNTLPCEDPRSSAFSLDSSFAGAAAPAESDRAGA